MAYKAVSESASLKKLKKKNKKQIDAQPQILHLQNSSQDEDKTELFRPTNTEQMNSRITVLLR